MRGYYSGMPDASDLQSMGGPAYNPYSPSPNIGGALRHGFNMFMGFRQQREERERQAQEDLVKQQLQQSQAEYYRALAQKAMQPETPEMSPLDLYEGKQKIDIDLQPERDAQALEIFKKQEEIKARFRKKGEAAPKVDPVKQARIRQQTSLVNATATKYENRIKQYEAAIKSTGIDDKGYGPKIENLKRVHDRLMAWSTDLLRNEELSDEAIKVIAASMAGINAAETDPSLGMPVQTSATAIGGTGIPTGAKVSGKMPTTPPVKPKQATSPDNPPGLPLGSKFERYDEQGNPIYRFPDGKLRRWRK